ncbi:MAG: phage tail protein [Candidatus ainarchaeum sp.]|nr:phage tail protein [Candidatus ainarchaeum sp.]
MKTFDFAIIALLASLLFFSGCIGISFPRETTPEPEPTPTPVICTMEARVCPDGTWVGRIPPGCEFEPCPTPEPTATPEPTEAPTPTPEPTPTPTPEPTPTPTPTPEPTATPTPTPTATPVPTPEPTATPVPTPTPTPTPHLSGGGEGDAPENVVWFDYSGAGYWGFVMETGMIRIDNFDRVGVVVSPGERLDAADPDALFLSNGPTGTPRAVVIRIPYLYYDDLWQWRRTVTSGGPERRDVILRLLNSDYEPVATYRFSNAWPYGYTVKVEDGMITETGYLAVEEADKTT